MKKNIPNLTLEEKTRAPYNFVQLNDIIVPSRLNKYIEMEQLKNTKINYANKNGKKILNEAGYKAFIKDGKKYSGYFDVTIENITPLYIGGESGLLREGIHKAIPGSSLRGCLKNIFRIITNSAMRCSENGNFNDGLFFWRSIAKDDLFSKEYLEEMSMQDRDNNKSIPKARAGFLIEFMGKKYVCPANFEVINNTTNIKKVSESPYIIWKNDYVDIFSGNIDKKDKCYFYRITKPIWDKRIAIANDFMKAYKLDRNRNSKNLFKLKVNSTQSIPKGLKFLEYALKKRYKIISPCFYCLEDGEVCHLGSSPYYRIPYKKTVAMHVPTELKLPKIDFTDAIFGNKEYWGSRVYVEDCYLNDEEEKNAFYKNFYLDVSSPNPTAYQFYLNVDENDNVQNWNGNTTIRGYKLYWHKKINWKGKQKEDIYRKYSKVIIRPLIDKCHFNGKVRFENLDKVELGALTYLFKLGEENCCYKLGMGKAMGLGSIKILADLYLREDEYYTKLFDDKGNFKAYKLEVNKQEYIECFNQYMYKVLNEHSKESLELYQKRMNNLKIIMGIENINDNKWCQKVSYMDMDNDIDKEILKKKIPLPSISEVIMK